MLNTSPDFDEFKSSVIRFGHQLFSIFSEFDVIKNQNQPLDISWKIDINIEVEKEGRSSPFKVAPTMNYEIVGLSVSHNKKLVDFGIHCLLESIFQCYIEVNPGGLPMGWARANIFGSLKLGRSPEGEQEIVTVVDVRHSSVEKIVAILLIKNCELSIEKVLESIRRTSDYQLVLDDNSTDSTLQILESLKPTYPGLIIRDKITGMSSSAKYIAPLLNTRTSIWRVDGDEFWGPHHIPIIKTILKSDQWKDSSELRIDNSMLNVLEIDMEAGTSAGYLGRPSSFFNFANILSWDQPSERLHGERRVTRSGSSNMEIEDVGILVAHFPLLKMSTAENTSFSTNLEALKVDRYKNKEINGSASLADFDCVEVIKKVYSP